MSAEKIFDTSPSVSQQHESHDFVPLEEPSPQLLSQYIFLYTQSQQSSQNPSPGLHPSHIPNLLVLYRYYEAQKERLELGERRRRQWSRNHGNDAQKKQRTRHEHAMDVDLNGSDDVSNLLPLLLHRGTTHTTIHEESAATELLNSTTSSTQTIAKILHILRFLIKSTLTAQVNPSPLDKLAGLIKQNLGMKDDEETLWKNLMMQIPEQTRPQKPWYAPTNQNQARPSSQLMGAAREGGIMSADLHRPTDEPSIHQLVTKKFSHHVKPRFDFKRHQAWEELETLIISFVQDSKKVAALTLFPLVSFLGKHSCIRDQWSEVVRIRLFVEDMYWKVGGHPQLLEVYRSWMHLVRERNHLERFLPSACRPYHVLCENLRYSTLHFVLSRTELQIEAVRDILFSLAKHLRANCVHWTVAERQSVWMYLRTFPQILLASWMLVHLDVKEKVDDTLADMISFVTCVDCKLLVQERHRLVPVFMSQQLRTHTLSVLNQPSPLDIPASIRNMGASFHVRLHILLFHCTVLHTQLDQLTALIDNTLDSAQTAADQIEIAKLICEFFAQLHPCEIDSILLLRRDGLDHLFRKVRAACKKERMPRDLICDRLESIARGEPIVYSPEIHHRHRGVSE